MAKLFLLYKWIERLRGAWKAYRLYKKVRKNYAWRGELAPGKVPFLDFLRAPAPLTKEDK